MGLPLVKLPQVRIPIPELLFQEASLWEHPCCWQLPTRWQELTRDDPDVSSDIREQFGRRIRTLRRKRGWQQVEMAALFGIDRSYLSEIETGKKDPGLRILKTFADGFEMTLSQLLRGL